MPCKAGWGGLLERYQFCDEIALVTLGVDGLSDGGEDAQGLGPSEGYLGRSGCSRLYLRCYAHSRGLSITLD